MSLSAKELHNGEARKYLDSLLRIALSTKNESHRLCVALRVDGFMFGVELVE